MVIVAAAITAVDSQPSPPNAGPTRKRPILPRWPATYIIAAIMGMFSAVMGGVIRDVLTNEIPIIFKKEIYATACLAGATLYLLLNYIGCERNANVLISALLVIVIRIIAVRRNLSLPKFTRE